MKLLGIDYGESKIGLAIGDNESRVAIPFDIIKNQDKRNSIEEIKNVCQKENIKKIIVGLPINPQASSSDQIKKIEDFIFQLANSTGIEVESQDERFSTQEAQKLIEKNKTQDDDISAMLILQSYIDKKF